MDFEKKLVIDAPINRVWELLLDPTVMAACVPGTESVEVVSDVEYLASLKVKISFIGAKFKVRTKILETRPPHYLKSEGTGEDASVGSSLKQTSELILAEAPDDKTELTMKIKVEVFGRLGSFGLAVMKTKADRMWEEFGENFNARAVAGTSLNLDAATQEHPVKAPDASVRPADEAAATDGAPIRSTVPTRDDNAVGARSVSNGHNRSVQNDSWWKRMFGGGERADSVVSLRRLPTDIYAEIERNGTTVRLVWPAQNAQDCVKWISEYLK